MIVGLNFEVDFKKGQGQMSVPYPTLRPCSYLPLPCIINFVMSSVLPTPPKKKEKLLVVLTTGQKNCTLMTHVTFLFVYSEMKLRSNSEEDAANSIWPAVEIRKMWESFAEKKLLVDDFEFFIHACSILFCLT